MTRSNTTDMILAQVLIADVVDPGPNQTSVASPGSSWYMYLARVAVRVRIIRVLFIIYNVKVLLYLYPDNPSVRLFIDIKQQHYVKNVYKVMVKNSININKTKHNLAVAGNLI
jgi:hypothetical protein